jgi:hypothetical protein
LTISLQNRLAWIACGADLILPPALLVAWWLS